MAAANTNSNLVFDFPDPTVNFDFNDTKPTKGKVGSSSNFSSTPIKKGKRFGKKFGSSKNKINNSNSGNGNDSGANNSPQSQSTSSSLGTATTTSLNTSLNNNGTPRRNHSGDIAAGPSSQYSKSNQNQISGNSSQSSSLNFTLDSGPSKKLNLPISNSGRPSPLSAHKRNTSRSSAHSASGYISEVSEFSFDRVTVTTNETGITRDSNVSWGFLDEAVGGMGGGQSGQNQSLGQNNQLLKNSNFAPYTGSETGVVLASTSLNNNVATAGTVSGTGKNNNSDNSSGTKGQGNHAPKTSSSTFDNVSLSEDEVDNIPFTGMVDHDSSNQSVISEISERTGGGPLSGTDEAIKALLREGMESALLKSRRERQQQQASFTSKSKGKTVSDKDGSPSRETHTTAKSSSASNNDCGQTIKSSLTSRTSTSNNLLEDIQKTYTMFKTTRNNGQKENKSSILHSIIEDIQFCGLYFCGIDTTQDGECEAEENYENGRKKKKEDQKKEADETLLGRVINCGNDVTCGGFVAL